MSDTTPTDNVQHIREYLDRKGFDAEDPRQLIFNDIVLFMSAVSENDDDKADEVVRKFMQQGKGDLFQEVGKITRRLHDSIKGFKEAIDPKLKGMAEAEIPNAVDKLQFVIEKTEEAANTTMTIVEKHIQRMDDLNTHIQRIPGPTETKEYLSRFRKEFENDLGTIMTTQAFQDITGQTIKKVIMLVGDIESELVRLVSTFGVKVEPGANSAQPVVSETVSQSDVDDLLKDLGF